MITEKQILFQRRPKRNIKIDKNENKEEVEEVKEGPKVDSSNNIARDESSNEDEGEQQLQQVMRKRGKTPTENGKTVSFNITNNGNDNHNDIRHHIFHSDRRGKDLESTPCMVLRSHGGQGRRGSYSSIR